MTISDVTQKTKCDMNGCKNLAELVISSETDSKKKMCFCKACLNQIYDAMAKTVTPKGIDAPFKKQKKLR